MVNFIHAKTRTATSSISDLLNLPTEQIYALLYQLFTPVQFIFIHMSTRVVRLYLLTSTLTTRGKRSRLYRRLSYILHYRCTYLEYYNNTSSDEFKLYFLSKRI